MNISEKATRELEKPVAARDYDLINLDLRRWREAQQWLGELSRAAIRARLAEMDEVTREDYRRRLNSIERRRKTTH